MFPTIDERTVSRARKAFAHAASKRADAYRAESSERLRQALDRSERAQRRAYVQALRLADLES